MKNILFIMFMLFLIKTTYAQNSTNRFAVGINWYTTDFNGPENGTFYKGETNNSIGPSNFTFGYNLFKPLNIATSYEFGGISEYPTTLMNDNYQKWDIGLQLRFAPLFKDKEGWFDPYTYANVGVAEVSDQNNFLFNVGLGINFWVSDNIAINVQSGWNNQLKEYNYYESTIGLKLCFGKKDRDGDGIADKDDNCPGEAGLAQFNGCPDKDNDGVMDKDDKCPNVAGTAALNGCPDKDNDGIADGDDECPNEAGTAALNGCPDKDNDGIADKNDSCPDVAGIAAFAGCPDTDGDGIADKDDACPDVVGTAALNGCPDKDNDGVADKDDNCPDVAGPIDNNGCPEMKAAEKKKVEKSLQFSARRIQFESGKDIIKKKSYKDLDKIVAIMNEYSYINFGIDGYTDNTGKAKSNLKLSQKRADAVKSYFVSKGIAESRLNAKGFGIENPIASNKTSKGRSLNRRVEIKLIK